MRLQTAIIYTHKAKTCGSGGSAIELLPGFESVYSSNFEAQINNNLSCGSNRFLKPIKPSKPKSGNQSNVLNSIKPSITDSLNILVRQSITKGQFYVGMNQIDSTELNKQAEVTVYNMLGQPLYQNTMIAFVGNMLPIDFSTKPGGLYIIIIRTKDRILHGKVILQ